MKRKFCIDDPIVERRKKPPKRLDNFYGYPTSEEHHRKTVEGFENYITKPMILSLQPSKKDLINLTITGMLLCGMFY